MRFRISNFEFAVPQPASLAWNPQSAWRCCGGPRREGPGCARHGESSSPHISPAFCCGRRCTVPSGVFSPRGARRTIEYALRAPQLQNPTGHGTSPPSRRNPVRYAGKHRRHITISLESSNHSLPSEGRAGRSPSWLSEGWWTWGGGGKNGVRRRATARMQPAGTPPGARGRSPAGPKNAGVPRARR